MNRRDVLQASAMAVSAGFIGKTAAGAEGAGSEPRIQQGSLLTAPEDSNPLDAKIVVFTTVSPDVDASIRFYRDAIGMNLAEEGVLPADLTTAPGIGKAKRRFAILQMPGSDRSAQVRVLDAPSGSAAESPPAGFGSDGSGAAGHGKDLPGTRRSPITASRRPIRR